MDVPAFISARVSRETADRLSIYAQELARWQPFLNLVSPASMSELWKRHIDDSLQIAELEPSASNWLDLGSGGGLPGLIVAAVNPQKSVWMVESDARKCAFLRTTARRMGLDVSVACERIETFSASSRVEVDVISARALAPLTTLLAYAQPFLRAGTLGLFHKGKDAERELTAARKSWIFDVDIVPSRTDPAGRILCIRDFAGPRT